LQLVLTFREATQYNAKETIKGPGHLKLNR